MAVEHKNAALGKRHAPHNYEYADATARAAATGFVAGDVGKVAWQQSDNSHWILTDDSPITWAQIGGTVADGSVTPAKLSNAAKESTLNFVIDGGGATITTGIKGDIVVDFACTIVGVTLLADQSGSIVIDLWKDAFGNYPPLAGDSITASAKPTISAATKAQDATLTGWTTSVSAGDIIRVNVDSATTVQRVTLAIKVRRA